MSITHPLIAVFSTQTTAQNLNGQVSPLLRLVEMEIQGVFGKSKWQLCHLQKNETVLLGIWNTVGASNPRFVICHQQWATLKWDNREANSGGCQQSVGPLKQHSCEQGAGMRPMRTWRYRRQYRRAVRQLGGHSATAVDGMRVNKKRQIGQHERERYLVASLTPEPVIGIHFLYKIEGFIITALKA